MKKQETIEVEGVVTQPLRAAQFKVEIGNGHEVLAIRSRLPAGHPSHPLADASRYG